MKKEQQSDYFDRAQQYREEAKMRLEEELNAYHAAGCVLRLDGKRCYPKHLAQSCVREKDSYMRDILYDEDQQVREINFIRLREEGGVHQVRHKNMKQKNKFTDRQKHK